MDKAIEVCVWVRLVNGESGERGLMLTPASSEDTDKMRAFTAFFTESAGVKCALGDGAKRIFIPLERRGEESEDSEGKQAGHDGLFPRDLKRVAGGKV